MTGLSKRVGALETKIEPPKSRWVRMVRYENETDAQAVAAYEAQHGPIGDDRVVMRVVVNKPGDRPNHVFDGLKRDCGLRLG